MIRTSRIWTLSLVLILAAGAAWAQGATTGSLAGQATLESDGSALPGTAITAVHGPTGTQYQTVTQQNGSFALHNLRVGGPYTVTATSGGFNTSEVTSVMVGLGSTVNLEFSMQLETVEEVVTVVAESGRLINPNRTGAASSVSLQNIESMPSVGRGLEDFARSNPFMTVGSENEDPDAISVAGRSSRYNNIQIDGSVNNDLFGLADTGTPGGQAGATPISLDALQEIQLVVSSFDVRQGGFSGGSVNAVTRSGSNDYNGSVYYYTRDDSLIGDGPESLGGPLGAFSEDQYGFRNWRSDLSRQVVFLRQRRDYRV